MGEARVVVIGEDTSDVVKDKFIYTLTTIHMKTKSVPHHKTKIPTDFSYGDSRVIAVCDDYEYLMSLAETNSADIHEGYYEYALVERVSHGLYPYCEYVQWYEWKTNGEDKYEGEYLRIDTPEHYNNICNVSIG